MLFAWRVTARSNAGTCWEKSEGPATSTPFSQMVALLKRLVPSGFPFAMCNLYGDVSVGGTGIVSVNWLGCPLA